MAEPISPETADELVCTLLGAACSLDHAVAGAVREGVSTKSLRILRRTAGEVMGLVYSYLSPCFSAVPALDPGRGGRPLAEAPIPLISGSRETFVRLLDEVDRAIDLTRAQYEAVVPEDDRAWLRQMRQEVLEATKSGRTAIAGLTT